MKKIIFCMSFLLMTHSYAGNVSGGGGNANGNAAKEMAFLISQVMTDSAWYDDAWATPQHVVGLFKWLNYNAQNKLYYKKVFEGHPNIADVIYTVNVDWKFDKACKDPDGKDVDGSADVATRTVCMSALRLSQKLSKDNYQTETLALYVHELSHLVGTSEAEANSLQEDFRANITKVKPVYSYPSHSHQGPTTLGYSEVADMVRAFVVTAMISDDSYHPERYVPALQDIVENATNLANLADKDQGGFHFRPLFKAEAAYLRQQIEKLKPYTKMTYAQVDKVKVGSLINYFRELANEVMSLDMGYGTSIYPRNFLNPTAEQFEVHKKWADIVGKYELENMNCSLPSHIGDDLKIFSVSVSNISTLTPNESGLYVDFNDQNTFNDGQVFYSPTQGVVSEVNHVLYIEKVVNLGWQSDDEKNWYMSFERKSSGLEMKISRPISKYDSDLQQYIKLDKGCTTRLKKVQ